MTTWDGDGGSTVINAGIGKTSDPKNLPQRFPEGQLSQYFQIFMKEHRIVHNHPSGDPTPSRADIEMTKEIIEAGKRLGIAVHDHIIIGRKGYASMKGLLLI